MVKLVFIFQGGGEELFFRRAAKDVAVQYPDDVSISLFDAAKVDAGPDSEAYQACDTALEAADFVYLSLHGAMAYFKSWQSLCGRFYGHKPAYIHSGIEDENEELRKGCGLSPLLYDQLRAYESAGGEENCRAFLLCLVAELGGVACRPGPPVAPQWEGLYGLAEGDSEEALLARLDAETRPIIGILVHAHNIRHKNTRHIDALIEAVRSRGGIPLAVYSNMAPAEDYGGLNAAIDRYLLRGETARVDALIVTSGHSLTSLSGMGTGQLAGEESVFARLNVPVLQAMVTFFTKEQWEASLAGLDSMLLCASVYQPEFDGQIITVPIGYTELEPTPDGARYLSFPLHDRIDKAAGMALGWARLRRSPMAERRVAIILHNQPPRADMIGCAYGLDTPESVHNMVRELQKAGLRLDYSFEDGQEIIQKITSGLTNDNRFLSERDMLERCPEALPGERYTGWHEDYAPSVKASLAKDWGPPPGEFMTVDGQVLIPGIHNGNLFIGLQPPRAFEEKAEEAYHATDMVCPHQYLAFYGYLRQVFDAHVLVHVGTHGTLEWLPGKEIGLSASCFPDVALGEIPHLYPYIIDVPGEGAQAKRRSDAVILDHLIPSMTDSGLYGEMTAIDDLIAQYHHAQLLDPQKLDSLASQIWQQTEAQSLHGDLELTKPAFFADPAAAVERVHLWLSAIKETKIKNGLHIFGCPPPGERYTDMLRLLVNIANGPVPSLRQSLCALHGEDMGALLTDPGYKRPDGTTHARHLEDLDEMGRGLFDRLARADYAPSAVEGLVQSLAETARNGDGGAALRRCLAFVTETACQKLNATTDELANFLRGIQGEFVPQGPSGAPSRGNTHILPTGRNFFMIDPTAVPSRASWQVGVRLANDLLSKHKAAEGKLPESVAIVVYSGETIKTGGDDLAEIMVLYGVRPVWLESTDRVIGLEVIPLEELGRPRIDVTLRISGLFRDTFPNLIERVEDAVNLVAALEEDEEDNFVKKHIAQDLRRFLEDGMSREQAFEYAKLRVFGCPPGTYGAGVDIMINSRKWETAEDLGKAYINWSAHAYSSKIHGAKLQDVFRRRLAVTDVTVKNISSYESDMLDDDDYYNYHGGLISAVKDEQGQLPVSYSTYAGDPEHVKTLSIHEDASRIMRARVANPKWLAGLKEHGYRGAQELSATVDFVFGWDATSSIIDDWMYQAMAERFVLDRETRDWITSVNPWALHAMTQRLLEAEKRGMWAAAETTLEALRDIYLTAEGELEGQ